MCGKFEVKYIQCFLLSLKVQCYMNKETDIWMFEKFPYISNISNIIRMHCE